MHRANVLWVLLLASVTARAATVEQSAAAAAHMAFNAASYCHGSQALYESAVQAFSNGQTEEKILGASGADSGSKSGKTIGQAVADAKSGIADPGAYYESCMSSVKREVYTLIENGGYL